MDFTDYIKAYKGFFKVLTIELGLKCPILCRHCFSNCGPHRPEHLDVDLVKDIISQFGQIKTSEIVMLTGGEPFIYRRNLNNALKEINRFPHLSAYIVTNGYWATTLERAIKVLQSLPKIDLIAVSADIFHEEFIPIDRVRNVLLACEHLGISGALTVCLEKGDEGYLNRLRRIFGENLLKKHFIWLSGVSPKGRAADFGSYPEINEENELQNICAVAGSPIVLHDGTISVCCGCVTFIREQDKNNWPYTFGQFPQKSLQKIYTDMEQDVITQGLRVLGPANILDILTKSGFNVEISSKNNYQCNLCMDLMRDLDAVEIIRELLSSPAYSHKIKLLRAFYYDEDEL